MVLIRDEKGRIVSAKKIFGRLIPIRDCKCGCGQKVIAIDNHRRKRFYVNGHRPHGKRSKGNFRAWNKGFSIFIGETNPNWRGGKTHNAAGYVEIRTDVNKHQYEHRVIMEKFLGRKLLSTEHIHHMNGDKTDNRIENLELLSNSDHIRLYHAMENDSTPA